jgi:hypothetical protein
VARWWTDLVVADDSEISTGRWWVGGVKDPARCGSAVESTIMLIYFLPYIEFTLLSCMSFSMLTEMDAWKRWYCVILMLMMEVQ